MAGIKDVWSQTRGTTKTKSNLIYACFKALKKLMETKVNEENIKSPGIKEGKINDGETKTKEE